MVVLNNSAGNWSGSSTEEESDNEEDLATVEQDLAEVRERLSLLQEEKLAAPGSITGIGTCGVESAWEEWSSQSDEEEFFGIDQEGKAVALIQRSSEEPGWNRPHLDCLIVEESTTEDESENEEPPQSAEFGIQRRATNHLWPPHTPRSGRREGRGRGRQVN